MKRFLTKIIDWFYLPFIRKFIPKDMFRYAACGGGNLLFDWVLFFLLYHFVFDKMNWDLGWVVISPHIAALLVSFPISTLTGFWLQNNIAFSGSPLREHTKLLRYFMVVGVNLLINYAGLKLFVEGFHFYPTPSKMAITLVTVVVSYLSQKYFTFYKPRGQRCRETKRRS